MTDPISTPAQMREALDTALADYTPGIDHAVRFVTIDQVDMLAEFYLHNRALPVAEAAPVAVKVKPLVWDKDKAETPLGVYIVVCEDWDEEPFWFVLRNGKPAARLGEHSSADAAKVAAEADHATRILSQIDAVPAAQVRAEALREAATLPPYDGDGDPAGQFDHHVFVKRDAIRALIEKEPNE